MSLSQVSYPIASVDEAYNACHPEIPLERGDPRYVDLTPVRGEFNLAETVARRIRRAPATVSHKQLITGHRGCGKSTELKQLQAQLREEGFFVVYLDIEDVEERCNDLHPAMWSNRRMEEQLKKLESDGAESNRASGN